ncbi:MAG: sigma-70 family RNA polymerase sigma factor [Planctomycetota bacterium]
MSDPLLRLSPIEPPADPSRGPVDGPSDDVLLRALADGREHAFDVLVARHGARVRTFLGHLVRDAAAADDLTQEVFLTVLTRAHARDRTETRDRSFQVWLMRVARNEAIDLLRRRGLHARLVARVREGVGRVARRLASSPARPEDEVAHGELLGALEEGLAELPEPQRSVFLLREMEGMSYEEIGDVLECSPKTVSSRLHRARAALRERLADHREETP